MYIFITQRKTETEAKIHEETKKKKARQKDRKKEDKVKIELVNADEIGLIWLKSWSFGS